MSRGTYITLDLAALQHNLACVRQLAPQSRILAMIKADGYGHGLLRMAQALTTADAFGVACLDEALPLRAAGIQKPIVLMEGFTQKDELALIDQFGFDVVVHELFQIDLLHQVTLKRPLRVWLKIDTGMHRLGLLPAQVSNAWARLQTCRNIATDRILMTHFSDADDINNPKTNSQIDLFHSLTASLSAAKSLANSAAIMAWPDTHADWVRPGIMLYGVSPLRQPKVSNIKLSPVMSFHSEIISIRTLQPGASIGYGSTWQCPEAMPVGIVAAGYGDGYPRHARNGTPVLVNGQMSQLIGRVSMDMLSVDLRNIEPVNIGDKVILWGNGLPVEQVAACSDTIGYELLLGITGRVQRRVV